MRQGFCSASGKIGYTPYLSFKSRNSSWFTFRLGQEDIVSFLLGFGANINLADRYGETPLLAAIKEKSTKTIDQLLSKQADVSYEDKSGYNALHAAVQSGVQEVVKKILGNCNQ